MSSKSNTKTKILFFLVILTCLFMLLSTYARFFYEKPKPKPNNNDNNDKISVSFGDTGSIALVNAKKGDKVNKVFTVKNISNSTLYYDIILSNLVNNFNDSQDLIYSLDGSKNAAYIKAVNVPKNSGVISSNVKLNSGEEHRYELNISVENNVITNNTFSADINVSINDNMSNYDNDTLGYKILNSNTIHSEKDIYSDDVEEINGLYYTNNTIDGKTVYFFRGNNDLNNNVIIGDSCYKIIRTTEDGGIRVIYNGLLNDGVCDGNENTISNSVYNSKSDYNAYVGYMYGTPNSSSYELEHQNVNSSKIKTELESFYISNLNKYSSLIKDSIYCNDRSTRKFTYNKVVYGISGHKNDNTGYEPMYRVINNDVSYKCEQKNDRLNSSSLSNSIGLITSDEVVYAGLLDERINNNYLNSTNGYWTMSPAYFGGKIAYNYIVKDGKLIQNNISEASGVRPVITLSEKTKVKSGNGSIDSPYVVY